MKVMVTGPRPKNLANNYELTHPINIAMGKRMRELVLSLAGYDEEENEFAYQEPITMVSGMALGVDTIWAMVALKLKRQFPERFRLYCAIPCKKQESKWRKKDQDRYQDIVSKADEVVYVSKETYTPDCMQKRNEHMVQVSDYLYGIWDGREGGTKNCIMYAKNNDIICHVEDPTEWIQSYQSGKLTS